MWSKSVGESKMRDAVLGLGQMMRESSGNMSVGDRARQILTRHGIENEGAVVVSRGRVQVVKPNLSGCLPKGQATI